MSGLDLIRSICARHELGTEGVAKVVDNLLWLGGYDMHELTRDMIIEGLSGAPNANWKELRWSMAEVCSDYAVMRNGDADLLTVIGALVVAVILAQTTRMDLGSGYELSGLLTALQKAAWELPNIDVVETMQFVVNELAPATKKGP